MATMPGRSDLVFDVIQGHGRCGGVGLREPVQYLPSEFDERLRGLARQDAAVGLALDEMLRPLVAGDARHGSWLGCLDHRFDRLATAVIRRSGSTARMLAGRTSGRHGTSAARRTRPHG